MPKQLLPWIIPSLVRENRVAVVYVSSTAPPTELVFDSFARHYNAATAWVDASRVFFDKITRDWLHARQRALGWQELELVPEGYYLFVDGEARAYHAGLLDPSTDGLSMLFGTIAGLDALLSKRGKTFRKALDLAYAEASLRVISAFAVVLGRANSIAEEAPPPPPQPPPPARDELLDSFFILGIEPSASERDVKRRYRELMNDHHPDRFAQDPDAERAATSRAQEITKAYAIIMARRGWRPNMASATDEPERPTVRRSAPTAGHSRGQRAAARRRKPGKRSR